MAKRHSPQVYGHKPGENLNNQYGRQMQSYEILPLFGLKPTSPIPPDFVDQKRIGNVMVYICTIENAKRFPPNRRVTAECPYCGKFVCAGHLHQHLMSCTEYGFVLAGKGK